MRWAGILFSSIVLWGAMVGGANAPEVSVAPIVAADIRVERSAVVTQKKTPDHVTERAVAAIIRHNPRLSEGEAYELWAKVRRIVERFRSDPVYSSGSAGEITPQLVLSMILVESSAVAKAKSSHGAIGLTQVMPVHHVRSLYSAGMLDTPRPDELWDEEKNIRAGTYILMCYAKSSGTILEALARYNGGRRVRAGMPYARKVLRRYSRIFG